MPPLPRITPLLAALALALGVAAAHALAHPLPTAPPLLASLAAATLALAAWRYRRRDLTLAALIALGAWRAQAAAPPPLPPAMVDDARADQATGRVDGPVTRTAHGWAGPLALDGPPALAGATVWLWSPIRVRPGDHLRVTGPLRTARGDRAPGSPDRRAQLAATGAAGELAAQEVTLLDDDAPAALAAWRWADDLQAAGAARLDAALPPDEAALLRGILLGDRAAIPPELDQRWRIDGIFHILSVSGLHLAIVAGLAFAGLRRAFAASPLGAGRHPARWAAPPALAIAVGYTLVTGAQVATLRALVVVALLFVAAALDRPLRLRDALGLAALGLLLWRPAELDDPSFQLSFVAGLTLALRPPGPPPREAAGRLRRLLGWLRRGAATSAWVTLTTAPLTAYHFHQLAPGGIVGNLLLTPLIELVAIPLGLAGLVLDPLSSSVGHPLLALAGGVLTVADRLAGWLAAVAPVGQITVATAGIMAALVALSVALAARPRAAAGLALCALWALARAAPPPGALRVTFVDVGQGDAAVLELPDGAVWVIDAGGRPGAPDLASGARTGETVARLLEAYGHDHVDLALLSHPHPDHYLGLATLGARLPIRTLATAAEVEPPPSPPPGRGAPTLPSFTALAAALVDGGAARWRPPLGVARRQAGVTLEVWGPRYAAADGAAAIEAADPVRTVNDNSLVVTVAFAGRRLLFPGDVEAEGEAALLAAGVPPVDVVKVPHHGSPTSSTPPFVAATHPRLAVISCGRGNRFRFPSAAVVDRWRAIGAEVARTDQDGAVTVTIDPDGDLAIDRHAPSR